MPCIESCCSAPCRATPRARVACQHTSHAHASHATPRHAAPHHAPLRPAPPGLARSITPMHCMHCMYGTQVSGTWGIVFRMRSRRSFHTARRASYRPQSGLTYRRSCIIVGQPATRLMGCCPTRTSISHNRPTARTECCCLVHYYCRGLTETQTRLIRGFDGGRWATIRRWGPIQLG